MVNGRFKISYLINMVKYAVVNGPKSCIVNTWDEAKRLTFGVAGSYCKKFTNDIDAKSYLKTLGLGNDEAAAQVQDSLRSANSSFPSLPHNHSPEDSKNFVNLFTNHTSVMKKYIISLNQLFNDHKEHIRNDDLINFCKWYTERAAKDLEDFSEKIMNGLTTNDLGSNETNSDASVSLLENKVTKKRRRSKSNSPTRTSGKRIKGNTNLNVEVEGASSVCAQRDPRLHYQPGGFLVVYTDGACSSNGYKQARAGIGVWFARDHPLNVAEPVKGRATNNNAEIQAASKAIVQARSIGVKKLCIYTDSKFLIQCVNLYLPKWKKNKWKLVNGSPVKNREELTQLDQLMGTMDSVKFEHVRGHTGDIGNTYADGLAKQGALLYYNNNNKY